MKRSLSSVLHSLALSKLPIRTHSESDLVPLMKKYTENLDKVKQELADRKNKEKELEESDDALIGVDIESIEARWKEYLKWKFKIFEDNPLSAIVAVLVESNQWDKLVEISNNVIERLNFV